MRGIPGGGWWSSVTECLMVEEGSQLVLCHVLTDKEGISGNIPENST